MGSREKYGEKKKRRRVSLRQRELEERLGIIGTAEPPAMEEP